MFGASLCVRDGRHRFPYQQKRARCGSAIPNVGHGQDPGRDGSLCEAAGCGMKFGSMPRGAELLP